MAMGMQSPFPASVVALLTEVRKINPQEMAAANRLLGIG
jgi:hypothetical protein